MSQVSCPWGLGQLTEAVNGKLERERIVCSSETENSERFSKIFSVTQLTRRSAGLRSLWSVHWDISKHCFWLAKCWFWEAASCGRKRTGLGIERVLVYCVALDNVFALTLYLKHSDKNMVIWTKWCSDDILSFFFKDQSLVF